MVRPAFTMIELIFALVIMAIVFISLPLILLRNADALEENLIQESIFLASAKMSHISSFQWDNNSSESGINTLATSDVVDVTAGDPALDRNSSDFRVGHFNEDKHRRMSPIGNPRSAAAVGLEGTTIDDIDDFNNQLDTAMVQSTGALTSEFGYKKQYRTDINVSYVSDATFTGGTSYASNAINFTLGINTTGVGITNLKLINISIDQNDPGGWTQTLLLRAYAANIGETDFYKRRY